jgi:hypothetical protein
MRRRRCLAARRRPGTADSATARSVCGRRLAPSGSPPSRQRSSAPPCATADVVLPPESQATLTKVACAYYPSLSDPTRRSSQAYARAMASGCGAAYRWIVRDQAGGAVAIATHAIAFGRLDRRVPIRPPTGVPRRALSSGGRRTGGSCAGTRSSAPTSAGRGLRARVHAPNRS